MKYLSLFMVFFLISGASASLYSLEFTQVEDKIVVKEGGELGSNRSYVDYDLLENTHEGYIFLKKVSFPDEASSAKITLNLDRGFILSDIGAFPIGYNITSDGEHISLVWNFKETKPGQTIAFFVGIEDMGNSSFGLFFWLIAIFILIYLVSYFTFSLIKRNKDSEKYLLDDEKNIIELLKKSERNEVWQKNIQTSLGLSKAKLSRLLRNLEARGLIKKIPFGNTNKVLLK